MYAQPVPDHGGRAGRVAPQVVPLSRPGPPTSIPGPGSGTPKRVPGSPLTTSVGSPVSSSAARERSGPPGGLQRERQRDDSGRPHKNIPLSVNVTFICPIPARSDCDG